MAADRAWPRNSLAGSRRRHQRRKSACGSAIGRKSSVVQVLVRTKVESADRSVNEKGRRVKGGTFPGTWHRPSSRCKRQSPISVGPACRAGHRGYAATSDASWSKGRPRGDVERMCDPRRFALRRKSFPAERTYQTQSFPADGSHRIFYTFRGQSYGVAGFVRIRKQAMNQPEVSQLRRHEKASLRPA